MIDQLNGKPVSKPGNLASANQDEFLKALGVNNRPGNGGKGQGNKGAAGKGSAGGGKGSGHHHHTHADHGSHHLVHGHHHHHVHRRPLVIRTVRILPGLIPLGCSYHSFVGPTPIISAVPLHSDPYPIHSDLGPAPYGGYPPIESYTDFSAQGAPFPDYPAPAPTYKNAPRFGAGSDYPNEISYQVDPSSELSTHEVRFLRGSAELADESSVTFLLNLAAALNSPELNEDNFVVEGHASAEGAADFNQELSQHRANAVFEFLVSEGVNPNRLLSVGHGESMARHPANAPEHLRAEDRRVVIFKLAQ